MFPFWKDVVAPILDAAAARRIVEVGALQGDNTELMLTSLGPGAELHVIDPVPHFDPADQMDRFAGRYVFHRDLSVNVLGKLPVMDAALLDGDHNWYTVLAELRLLARVAKAHDSPLPVCILHDVAWPYGRRDLYYDPSNIPDRHRQPWARRGILPGRKQLSDGDGGFNSALANAVREGGPCNGVMTAVEDFIAEHDKPLRLVVVPVFFGLAILVEHERLAALPDLAAELDHLESREGKEMLLELGEEIRIKAAMVETALYRQLGGRIDQITNRVDDMADRYLAAIKIAADASAHADLEGATNQGPGATRPSELDRLHQCLDSVWAQGITGDLAVCGVDQPGPAVFMAAYLRVRDIDGRPAHGRRLWITGPSGPGGSASLDRARAALSRFDLVDDNVCFSNDSRTTFCDVAAEDVAIVHIGRGLGAAAGATLGQLYTRLVEGGIVVIGDGLEKTSRQEVESLRSAHGLSSPTDSGGTAGVHWVKGSPEGYPARPARAGNTDASRNLADAPPRP